MHDQVLHANRQVAIGSSESRENATRQMDCEKGQETSSQSGKAEAHAPKAQVRAVESVVVVVVFGGGVVSMVECVVRCSLVC